MQVKTHGAELALQLSGYFYGFSELLLLRPVALGEDDDELLLHLVQHLDYHAIRVLEAVADVHQQHHLLTAVRRRVLQVVFDQLAPLQDLVLGSIAGIAVSGSVHQQGRQGGLDAKEGQLLGLAGVPADLHELSADELVDECALAHIAASEEDKLLEVLLVGHSAANIGGIAQRVDASDCELADGLRVNERTIEEGEELLLGEVDACALFG
jgi:hypothetical protein